MMFSRPLGSRRSCSSPLTHVHALPCPSHPVTIQDRLSYSNRKIPFSYCEQVKKKTIPIGRPSVLRFTNAHGILKLLRESGTCSRADLVRASGLSAPAVTNVVKDLLAATLARPLREGKSSGGAAAAASRLRANTGDVLWAQK